jgi:hypothetical protein
MAETGAGIIDTFGSCRDGSRRAVDSCTPTTERRLMTLEEKKRLVVRFLEQCNDYADGQLARLRAELEHARGAAALELTDKMTHWAAYRAFNEHAIAELATPRLDAWLD